MTDAIDFLLELTVFLQKNSSVPANRIRFLKKYFMIMKFIKSFFGDSDTEKKHHDKKLWIEMNNDSGSLSGGGLGNEKYLIVKMSDKQMKIEFHGLHSKSGTPHLTPLTIHEKDKKFFVEGDYDRILIMDASEVGGEGGSTFKNFKDYPNQATVDSSLGLAREKWATIERGKNPAPLNLGNGVILNFKL